MRLDVAVAVRARHGQVAEDLAREDVGGPVEASHEGVARGLRSCGVVLVRARASTASPCSRKTLSTRCTPDAVAVASSLSERRHRRDDSKTRKPHGDAAVRPLGPS